MQLLYSKRVLTGWPSVFLDGIRFLAALIVLVSHCRAGWFPEGELDMIPSNLSHGAVVIFFVLSGFVIAHTTSNGNRGAKAYAIARLSRLYSVFLPAMIITIVCAVLVRMMTPAIYEQYYQKHAVLRYFASIIFCNEIWFFSSAPLINGPIWSLSYEFWYYVIFGAFFYKKQGLKGYVVPVIVCVFAGPKIMLLMFMWLVGWLVYHLPRPSIAVFLSWILIIALFFIAVYLIIFLPSMPNRVNTTSLHWADKFISDFIVSVLIGAIFYFLPNGQKNLNFSSIVMRFRKVADLTFPIYVLHLPLLVLSKSLLSHILAEKMILFGVSLAFVFLGCITIGLAMENNRKYWSELFTRLFCKVQTIKQALGVPIEG
jgi:peptidoglycan/LPS O-acetylase OafA/YrhL